MRSQTSYGRFHVGEAPSALASLHFHDGSELKEVDWEPKVEVLDQEDLIAQGIDTSVLIPGAQKVDALGSCTANATTGALSNLLSEEDFAAFVYGKANVVGGSVYNHVVEAEEAAIRFYHACTAQTGQPSQEWPPTDCGSSGPYIVSELERLKLISGAKVAAPNAESIVSLLQQGALIVGQPFLNAWETPSGAGFIDGNGSQATLEAQIRQGVAGGHETVLSAVEKLVVLPTGQIDAQNTIIRFRNSWSRAWGTSGNYRAHLSTYVALAGQCDFRLLLP